MDLAISALRSEADIRASLQDVCFVPKAEMTTYSITSSASDSNAGER